MGITRDRPVKTQEAAPLVTHQLPGQLEIVGSNGERAGIVGDVTPHLLRHEQAVHQVADLLEQLTVVDPFQIFVRRCAVDVLARSAALKLIHRRDTRSRNARNRCRGRRFGLGSHDAGGWPASHSASLDSRGDPADDPSDLVVILLTQRAGVLDVNAMRSELTRRSQQEGIRVSIVHGVGGRRLEKKEVGLPGIRLGRGRLSAPYRIPLNGLSFYIKLAQRFRDLLKVLRVEVPLRLLHPILQADQGSLFNHNPCRAPAAHPRRFL